jgi:hypothetical protein
MRIACGERIEWLRRNGVKQRIDRVRIGGLQTGIGLETVPGRVSIVDVLVNPSRLYLFVIVAGMGDALAIGAAITIGRRPRCWATVAIEWTAKNRKRHSTCIAVKAKHFLVKRHQ